MLQTAKLWSENKEYHSIFEQGLLNFLKNNTLNPFAPGDFAKKRVLELVEWFSGHCRAIKS